MTEGKIGPQLISYALPLLAGNLLQQLYNTVDSVTVGRFVGKEALAAVTSTETLVTTVIGMFVGISAGATIVIAQYFGAGDKKRLHDSIHTTIGLTIIMGILMTFAGGLGTPWMLRLMSTPDDVFNQAVLYLRIYFSGILGLVMYNMCSGILRAVGDSKRPLVALGITSVLNIVLDVTLVVVFKMGVAGVAIATVFSQFVSAVYLVWLLIRAEDSYRLEIHKIRIDRYISGRIFALGIPAGLQRSLVSFSNTLVISRINGFGSGTMAAWGVYRKIDEVIMNCIQSMSLAVSTFVGQNVGAGKEDRIKSGSRASMLITLTVTVVLCSICLAARNPLVRLFNTSLDVLEYGGRILMLLMPLQWICCFIQIPLGELRGRGDSMGPMIITLVSFVFIRQIFLYVGWNWLQTLNFVVISYPVGWACAAVLMLTYRKYKVNRIINALK